MTPVGTEEAGALPEFFDGTPMVSNADTIARPGAVASKLRRLGVRVLRGRINALMGNELDEPINEQVKRVQAVRQPAPNDSIGASGANGGLIPIVTDDLLVRNTVLRDATQVRAVLLDRTLLDIRDYRTLDGQTNGLRVASVPFAGPLLGVDFILGEDELG